MAEQGFIFTAAGDYGSSADTTATLELIARSGAAFHLALGDLSYDDRLPESAWCAYVKDIVGPTFPFQLVAGNHEDDYGEYGHITRFAACLPDRLGVTGDYPIQYYFDVQDLARFVIISPDLTINGEHYYYGEHNQHYRWVEQVVDDARAAGIRWVIMGMHKNCLSMGSYYCNIYEDLFNLIVDRRIDLVLHGHDHTYQRSKQLATNTDCTHVPIDDFDPRCVVDNGDDRVYRQGAGTVFVIVGTAGADLWAIDPEDAEAGYFARWMGMNVEPRKGFLRCAVSRTEISAEFVGSTATSDFTDAFRITDTT
jgi:hypothetical protein